MSSARIRTTLLFSAALLGCATGSRPGEGTCASDVDCPRGRCVDGRCVAGGADAGTPGSDAGPAEVDAGPVEIDAGPMCLAAADCDDLDACTTDECAAGSCAHAAVACDDGDACTTDGCDPASGCTTAALSCDDGDACTTDGCDPATGCTNVRTTVPGSCSDPIDVSAGGTFTGDSRCAASSYSGVCSGALSGDVAFVLDVSARSTVTLDASGSSFMPVLFLGDSCGSAARGCDATGSARLTAELLPGRYFVGLDGRASSDAGAWSLSVTITPVVVSETITFPTSGDPRYTMYTNMWNAGDYVQGSRTTSLPSVTSVEMTLSINPNILSCDTQDMRLMINGVEVGRFAVAPGATTVSRTFSFPAVAGPTYTLRLETVRTVSSGCGSAGLPDGVSTFRLSS